MPLKIVCSKCGYVLYDGKDIISVTTIIDKYRGRCPKCKHRFSTKNIRMKILPVNLKLLKYMQKG